MALAELLSTLEAEANAEVQRELDRARAEAASIVEETSERVARRSAEALAGYESALQKEASLAIARRRREARGTVLAARASMIERILDATRAALPSVLERPELDAMLRNDLDEALAAVGDDRAIVRCAPVLAKHLSGRTAVESDEALGLGFEVVSADRKLRIDRTFTTRIERLRPALAIVIAARVGGELP